MEDSDYNSLYRAKYIHVWNDCFKSIIQYLLKAAKKKDFFGHLGTDEHHNKLKNKFIAYTHWPLY